MSAKLNPYMATWVLMLNDDPSFSSGVAKTYKTDRMYMLRAFFEEVSGIQFSPIGKFSFYNDETGEVRTVTLDYVEAGKRQEDMLILKLINSFDPDYDFLLSNKSTTLKSVFAFIAKTLHVDPNGQQFERMWNSIQRNFGTEYFEREYSPARLIIELRPAITNLIANHT